MAICFKSISENEFNEKYKNRLRDFYIYQFKSSEDYYVEKKGKNNNKILSASTVMYDRKRLQSILSNEIGLEWNNQAGVKAKKCVSADSRNLTSNPFFELYNSCSLRSQSRGENFAIALILLLFLKYFQEDKPPIGFSFIKYDVNDIKCLVEEEILKRYCESKHYNYDVNFDCIPEENKKSELETIINVISKTEDKDSRRLKELFNKLMLDGKMLDIDDGQVIVKDCHSISYKYLSFIINRVLPTVKSADVFDIINQITDLVNDYDLFENGQNIYINKIKALLLEYQDADEEKMKKCRTCISSVVDDYKSNIPSNNLYYLDDIALLLNRKIGDDELRIKINEFAALGILNKTGSKYEPSDNSLPDFNDENFKYRFCEMIKFYSETQPLGEIGSFICNRLDIKNTNLSFKHNYLLRALNDYNLFDILYAIKNKKWLKIEYRSAKPDAGKYEEYISFPISVRESTVDGRQYLICYAPEIHSVLSLRIDFIDKIEIGGLKAEPDFFKDEMEIAERRIAYTFGCSFPAFYDGSCRHNPLNPIKEISGIKHIEAIITYDSSGEGYILNRIKRELDFSAAYIENIDENYFYKDLGQCVKISVNVTDASEFIKWLKTFTKRVVSASVDGIENSGMCSDLKDMQSAYLSEITCNELFSLKDQLSEYIKYPEREPVHFIKENIQPHSYLFNENFSKRFKDLCQFVLDYVLTGSEEECQRAKDQYILKLQKNNPNNLNKNDILQISYQFDYFILCFGKGTFQYKDNYRLNNIYDLLPLTNVEMFWLNSVLNDDKAKLFLSDKEISDLLALYPENNFFSFSDVFYFNQYRLNYDFYRKAQSGEFFKTLLISLNEKKSLKLKYFSINEKKYYEGIYSPIKVEYSKRDDTFRIYAINNDIIRVLNLERIVECEICDVKLPENAKEQLDKYILNSQRTITVKFKNQFNVPDRILTEFSPWKKECIFDNKTQMYTMSLWYDMNDTFEIVIRLLGYGRNVFIINDTGTVRQNVFLRIGEQIELLDELETIKVNQSIGDER